jgi:hypothetical protein
MSIGFNTITGVLKGDKLLKISHQTFQFLVRRDTEVHHVIPLPEP